MKLFIDSDVIISSLISDKGASYFLLNTDKLNLFVSNLSIQESAAVCKRLGLDDDRLDDLIKRRCETVHLKSKLVDIRKNYEQYVSDKNDAHVVAGAVEAGVNYLITYNLKDYNLQKIKEDFDIIIMTPGMFLQFLRNK
jgi:putative PIN family toxin of toxin-antitoxin system